MATIVRVDSVKGTPGYPPVSGGAIPTSTLQLNLVAPVSIEEARAFVRIHHYSEVMPRITRVCLGGYINGGTQDERLMAVATLGFGTRPLHTIRKLFPSLGTNDYLELGKLCVSDEMPPNSESWFIAQIVRHLKQHHPEVILLFSWADGIIGKPGYVYQASNFFYGGFIWTEMYLDAQGNRCHVRSVQGDPRLPQSSGAFKTRAYAETSKLGYQKFFGLQFRYLFPLCHKQEWEQLRLESTVSWQRGHYPKHVDCVWKKQTGKGTREACLLPTGIRTKYSIGRHAHQK